MNPDSQGGTTVDGGLADGLRSQAWSDEAADPGGLWRDRLTSAWPWGLAAVLLSAAAAAILAFPDRFLAPRDGALDPKSVWLAAAIPGVLALGALGGGLHSLISRARPRGPFPGGLLLAAAEAEAEGWAMVDGGGRIHLANLAFERLFPSTHGVADEGRGSRLPHVADVLAADDSSRREFERLWAGARAGLAGQGTMRIRSIGGVVAERRLVATPLGGEFEGTGHALWRISEGPWPAREDTGEIETEDAEGRQFRRDLLDNLPVGVFSIGGEGRLLYVNQEMADWLGRPARALIEDPTGLARHVPQDSDGGRTYGGEEGDGQHGEIELESATGERFRVYLHQSSVHGDDGAFRHSRSVALRDLVPRLSQEALPVGDDGAALEGIDGFAVRHVREGQRWLFQDAPVGIAMVDHQGLVLDCNRAYRKLIGLHREAILERPIAERIAPEDRSEMNAQLSKLVMGTLRATHFEVRMPGIGERDVTASVYASRMTDEEGEPVGAVLHFIDTTEQKVLEQQFNQSQKMQAVGQLAGGVAHDFNNLLTAMIGFCDLLLARHGPGDASFKDIMQIKQNANRATGLVRQLLAFSRRQTLQPRLIDINEALSELSKMLRRLLGEKIELVMEPSPLAGLVRVDPGQFDQVIVNLVVNARDAMPGGGVLTVRTRTHDFEEPVRKAHEIIPSGRYVSVEVADTGTGIAKEDLERIFEPFFSTKEVGKGTGLGLSTVYGIVRQTDGYIFVESALGEGSEFIIFLPREDPARDGEAAGQMAPETGSGVPLRRPVEAPDDTDLSGTGTILLVEDEEAVRLFGARALSSKGYKVLEAADGEKALEVLQTLDGTLDMIISDVVMPGMDGQTLVRLVRTEMPDVKVILISGYAEDAIPEEIGRDPSVNFLPKPFSLRQLAAMVKEVMEGS